MSRTQRILFQVGADVGPAETIRPRLTADRDRTVRGGAVNQSATRNSHDTIACAASSPRGDSPQVTFGAGRSSTTATARHHCRAVVRPPKHDVPEKPSDMGNPRLPEIPVFFSPAAALRHRDRSQYARTPQRYSYLRPGLSSTAFKALTEGSVTSIYGSSASKLVRCHGWRIHRMFDVSVDGFPEQGRQVLLPKRSS